MSVTNEQMSRCEKHIVERPLAVVPAFDVLSGPGELAVVRITGVTAIGNKETIRTKATLAGTLLFGRIKGSDRCSGVAVSRRCTVYLLTLVHFRTLHVILSRILCKKSPFRHSIATNATPTKGLTNVQKVAVRILPSSSMATFMVELPCVRSCEPVKAGLTSPSLTSSLCCFSILSSISSSSSATEMSIRSALL